VKGLLAANLVLASGLAFGGWTTRAIQKTPTRCWRGVGSTGTTSQFGTSEKRRDVQLESAMCRITHIS
jgi:hypothetical protein